MYFSKLQHFFNTFFFHINRIKIDYIVDAKQDEFYVNLVYDFQKIAVEIVLFYYGII